MKVFVSMAMLCLLLVGTGTTYGADKKEKEKAVQEVDCCGNDEDAPKKGSLYGENQMCAIFPLYPLPPDEPNEEKYVYYALFWEGCDDPDPSPDYLIGFYYWEALCNSGYCVEANPLARKAKSPYPSPSEAFEGMDNKIAGDFEILDRDGVQERSFEIPKGPARKSSRRVNVPKRFLQFTPFGQDKVQTFRVFGIDRATKMDKGAPDDEDDIIYVAYQTEKDDPPGGQLAEVISIEKIRTTEFAYRVKAIVKPNTDPVTILVLLAK